MNDYVWVSNMREDTTLTKYMITDISEKREEQAIEGLRLNRVGKPVPPELCPKKIRAEEIHETRQAMKPKYTPEPVFDANGFWIMCSEAAEIFQRFDLGGGALYPVSEGVWAPDPAFRDPREWLCWIFGNVKRAFSEAHSPLAPGRDGPELRDICNFPWEMGDDVIAVSEDAKDGPDVWIDRTLMKSVFLSRPLGDAVDAAGLRQAFRLYRARVI